MPNTTITSPLYKLLGALVILVAAGVFGQLGLIDSEAVKLALGVAGGALFGYSLNGFGQLKGVPDQVRQAMIEALAPICQRLDTLETAVGLTPAPVPSPAPGVPQVGGQ